LINFSFGYSEKDKPLPILNTTLKNDKRFELQHLKCLSPVSENFCSSLKLVIKEHHLKFIHLYGASFYNPKLHFLIHYPEQMLTLDPMLNTWTIRYEAKLCFIKTSISKI